MEHVSLEDAVRFANSPACAVYEYSMENSEMSIAVAEISERYPIEGYITNTKCDEIGYILKGSGKLVTEKGEVTLSPGGVFYIPHGEKFYWEGDIVVVASTTPAWYPEQHEEIE